MHVCIACSNVNTSLVTPALPAASFAWSMKLLADILRCQSDNVECSDLHSVAVSMQQELSVLNAEVCDLRSLR